MSEGPVNLNWGPIMKTINESPYDFFQQGGWSFLGGTGVGEDGVGVVDDVLKSKFDFSHRAATMGRKPSLNLVQTPRSLLSLLIKVKAVYSGILAPATILEARLVTMTTQVTSFPCGFVLFSYFD